MKMNKTNSDKMSGAEGENIVNSFIDKKLTKLISFPNPKTTDKAQVCDNLIWLNHDALMVEVKTRTEGETSIDKWARSRIQEGVTQLSRNYKKIKNGERITLHNRYFDVTLDNDGLTNILGLIILVHDEEFKILPSESEKEIYNQDIPIQVLSINDLNHLSKEIDTLQDFIWYLMDRFNYLKKCDISTCCELEPLGHYYANEYSFPKECVDFTRTNYWITYQKDFKEQIITRDDEDKATVWIDILESNYSKYRKLHDGL